MNSKNSNRSSSLSYTQLIFIGIGLPLVLLIFIIYVFEINPNQSYKPIKLATGEWAPYSGEDLEDFGVASAIITDVLNDIGYQPEYQFMSWPMAEERAAAGEADDDIRGTFPYTENDSRKTRFYFSETLLSIEFAVFYHKDNNPEAAKISGIEDLASHSVLAVEGYEYPAGIREYISGDKLIMNTNYEAFLELEKRKAPLVVVEAVEVGIQLLEQMLPHLVSQIRLAPLRNKLDIKLMLSKKNPNNLTLLRSFNEKLESFKNNENAFVSFQERVKKRNIMSRAVLLEPYKVHGEIRAYKDKSKNEYIVLPKGSKALVKQWDKRFLYYHQTSNQPDTTSLVEIQLLNGPFSRKNNNLFVDGRSIRLP